ncbi:MAG: TolC family protein [gamma proteobacterium symbiont of Bathyaustriella thionipta]|nr:TolC family protein [gamma proteobacterium symbiont of Bathyaustriella thionipta]
MKINFRILFVVLLLPLSACKLGPEFVKPEVELADSWTETGGQELKETALTQNQWWLTFNDPLLNNILELAWKQNNTLEIAGLRVLQAQAQLGIATGNLYPQSQVAVGDATRVSPSNNSGGSSFNQYNLAATASWEIDFWGRFERGIESADADFSASIAARDQALILLTAQVVDT